MRVSGLWAVVCLAPLPFFVGLFYLASRWQELDSIEEALQRVAAKSAHREQIQKKQSALLAPLYNADPKYLDKQLETLSFLLPETKKMEALLADAPGDEALLRRMQALRSSHNHLLFAEEKIRSDARCKEVEVRQQHPVEINEEDLKRVLCLIEGITIWPYGPKEGRPLLIIKEFTLTKKELFPQEKAFVMSLELIKREGLGTS